MNNRNSLKFFNKMSVNSKSSLSVKLSQKEKSDHSQEDADFILKFAKPKDKILDVGSGTGLIVNKIYQYVDEIHCIEPFLGLSKYIDKNNNVFIYNCDAFDYYSDLKFNIITFFAVMQYFNTAESKIIYSKFYNYLANNSIFIIKNQFGKDKDVIIDGYSDELQQNYYSEYRFIDHEIDTLYNIGFKRIDSYDIYPPEYNRWSNTHFYALVCYNF